jgi:hypothetical protein
VSRSDPNKTPPAPKARPIVSQTVDGAHPYSRPADCFHIGYTDCIHTEFASSRYTVRNTSMLLLLPGKLRQSGLMSVFHHTLENMTA